MALSDPDSYSYLVKLKERSSANGCGKSVCTVSDPDKPAAAPRTSPRGNDKDAFRKLPQLAVEPTGRGGSFSGAAPTPASPKHWTDMTSPTAALRQSRLDGLVERSSNSSSSGRFNLAEATAKYARCGARLTVSMSGRDSSMGSPTAALRRGEASPKHVDMGQNQAIAVRETRAALEGMLKLGMPKWEAESDLESEKQRRHQLAVHLLTKQTFTF